MDPTPFRRDPPGPVPDASTDRRTPCVLVVDDSRFVRASLVRGLASRFRVQQAESGERAWELLLLDDSIGAVLSDLSMPGMDGFELLGRVRGSMLERVRTVPFAVLSGADDAAHRARAQALGADRFVVKGDGVDALGDWVASRLAASPDRPAPDAPAAASPTSVPAPTPSVDPRGALQARPVPVEAAPVDPAGTTGGRGDGAPPEEIAASTPGPVPAPRLVPDPLQRWFGSAAARPAGAAEAAPALLRLHAPGLPDLHARLRRGVRAADALHLDGADTAWLCVPASGPLAVRLALRFGLLAAGRLALASGPAARVSVCVIGVDPARPADALAALQSVPPDVPADAGLALRAPAGPWGPGWRCTLPWPAARLLVAG